MNKTNIFILKALRQNNIQITEFTLQLNLDKSTILKSINQINDFLKEKSLPEIYNTNNKLTWNIKENDWKYICSDKNSFGEIEILDYLFIRLVFDNLINLEKEREKLDLSRSSISRYFLKIKNLLDDLNCEYKSINGKGIKIIKITRECQNVLLKKVLNVFLSLEYSFESSYLYKDIFKEFSFNYFLKRLMVVLKKVNFNTTDYVISFLFIVYILSNLLTNYKFPKEASNIHLKEQIDQIFSESTNLQKYILNNALFSIMEDQTITDKLFSDVITKIYIELTNTFYLKNLDKKYEKLLYKKIYFSIFKYQNNIFKTDNLDFSALDRYLLEKIMNIFKNNNIQVFHIDIIMLLIPLKEVLIQQGINDVKSVLLINKSFFSIETKFILEKMKNSFPKIEFQIANDIFYKNFSNLYDVYDIKLFLDDNNTLYNSFFNYELNYNGIINIFYNEIVLKHLNIKI